MQSQESEEIAAVLAYRVECGAAATEIAEMIARTCRDIDSALTPIIGQRGVAALYQRSLYLASQAHACLASAPQDMPKAMDVAALGATLAQQTSAEAAAAGTLLLQTFHELLSTLVGATLTERLLRAVWAGFLSGASAGGQTP